MPSAMHRRSGSAAPSPAARSCGRYVDDGQPPYAVYRRSSTTTSTTFGGDDGQKNSGFGSGAVMGGILGAAAGVAAGAALTFNWMKSGSSNHEKSRMAPMRQEWEEPPFSRRATYHDSFPEKEDPRLVGMQYRAGELEYPYQHQPPFRDQDCSRPQHLDRRHSHARALPPAQGRIVGEIRDDDDDDQEDDRRSRHSSRHRASSRAPSRTHSEVSTIRKPLLLTEGDHRSQVSTGSKRSSRPPQSTRGRSSVYGKEDKSMRDRDRERDRDDRSHVSSRSRRSSSTARTPTTPATTPRDSPRSPAAFVPEMRKTPAQAAQDSGRPLYYPAARMNAAVAMDAHRARGRSSRDMPRPPIPDTTPSHSHSRSQSQSRGPGQGPSQGQSHSQSHSQSHNQKRSSSRGAPSHASSRSRRSSSKQPPPPPSSTGGRNHRSSSRHHSYYKPASEAPTDHSQWDDDLESLAPDDSISNVGARSSGRRYY